MPDDRVYLVQSIHILDRTASILGYPGGYAGALAAMAGETVTAVSQRLTTQAPSLPRPALVAALESLSIHREEVEKNEAFKASDPEVWAQARDHWLTAENALRKALG